MRNYLIFFTPLFRANINFQKSFKPYLKRLSVLLLLIAQPVLAQEKTQPLHFGATISTCLPAIVLWQEFNQALLASKNSKIWPNNLSFSVGEGLENGAEIAMTYKSTFSNQTYGYSLSDVEKPYHFTYSAIPEIHPFTGGATIEIKDFNTRRQLIWMGEYMTSPSQFIQRLFLRSYSKKFFRQLEINIKGIETTDCL